MWYRTMMAIALSLAVCLPGIAFRHKACASRHNVFRLLRRTGRVFRTVFIEGQR